MTLTVHRATDTGVLAEGLADLLATPLADPFAEEVVVVPARGVERWLTQRLSHRLGAGTRGGDGVCAGVRFLNPQSLVAMLLGRERDDPWEPERLAWTVLGVIDESLGEPWCATLTAHLGHGASDEDGELRQGRRWSVARRLAGLFASYAVQRPQLVTDWREGRDTDGLGDPLEVDLRWQAELWRRVVDRVDAPAPDQRLADTIVRLRAGDDGLELPGRLSLFGHTRMPVTEVALLEALGTRQEVHLWLPQASPARWDRMSSLAAEGPVPRHEDRSVEAVAHPLLAALGRDARETQRTLARAATAVDAGMPHAGTAPDTLLGWLQDDIHHDRGPGEARVSARQVAPADRSVQVHACHGRARQVEVLREVLTGLLADDPTLEPRDILVMCPDIEEYAPLVQAGFGLADVAAEEADGHPAHRLRVRLADRAPRHTNPLLAVAADLVRLAGGRVTASEVLDLARAAPVRWRFGLDEEDLERLADWARDAVIRWGLDSDHRGAFGLHRFGQNTWRFGLDRILTGVAVDGTEVTGLGTALALDDLDSGDIDLAGRLAELLDRLGTALVRLRECRTGAQWADALQTGVLSLADVSGRDTWQVTQFEREIARIHEAAGGEGGSTILRLSDVAAVLDDRLGGRPTRASFRTGTLTVCTLVPMRSVPHRVVCLVGLDDGVFPRTTTVDGDNVLARTPVTGERDPRSEDRQLLLDAVMAARETLVVTYTGADEFTGAERPPAVPLGELIDAVPATVVRHPLQPFDPRNLTPGALVPGSDHPFSFDRPALAGARAASGARRPATVVGDEPLPPASQATVALADLQRFLAHPARQFLLRRLGVLLPAVAPETGEGIPIALDGLQKWAVGDRILRDVLAGRDLEVCRRDEVSRGLLPPDSLGRQVLDEVCEVVETLAGAAAPLRAGTRHTVDIDIDLGDGRRLVGTVPHLVDQRAVVVTYSSVRGKQRLASWLTLLALTAGRPDREWTSHVVGRRRGQQVHITHGPVSPEDALTRLRELIDVHDRGMREPLPLPAETALAYADAVVRDGDHEQAPRLAERAWKTQDHAWTVPGEQEDPAHVRLYGRGAELGVLLGPPREDEVWFPGETSRLGQYARRVWTPVLSGPERTAAL